jgi:hypothetical protein
MLYDLIQKRRGKESVVMTDVYTKVNSRMATLRKSQRKGVRGERVEYAVRPTTTNEKYKKPPTQSY